MSRGTLSSIELFNFRRVSNRSGRATVLSDIFVTLQADDFPLRYRRKYSIFNISFSLFTLHLTRIKQIKQLHLPDW